jgi:outer membrane protein assembly factor BamA
MRALIFFLTALVAQCGTIGAIRVEGNSRFPAAAVIAASGLKPGVSASPQDLAAASQRLMDTGLFSLTNYRYVPARIGDKPVIDVTLVVVEVSELRACRIQIPGTEEESVWAWLARNEPLVQQRVPANDAAESFYLRAIERFMAERLGRKEKAIAKLTESLVYLFRPEILPKVGALRFEGNPSIPAADLAKALGRVANGSEYTELEFREWVEYNVRPLYENIGRLRVSFPRVTAEPDASGGVTVTTVVEEGAVFHLESIEVAGEDLPPSPAKLIELKPGDMVDALAIRLGASKIERSLQHYGYLNASSKIDRTLDDQKKLARVMVTVSKGRLSRMGQLHISGLDAQWEARNRARWPVPPGAPLDMDAIRAYRIEIPRPAGVKVNLKLQPQAGSDVVDVAYTIQ